jgi:hypothetical protein
MRSSRLVREEAEMGEELSSADCLGPFCCPQAIEHQPQADTAARERGIVKR